MQSDLIDFKMAAARRKLDYKLKRSCMLGSRSMGERRARALMAEIDLHES